MAPAMRHRLLLPLLLLIMTPPGAWRTAAAAAGSGGLLRHRHGQHLLTASNASLRGPVPSSGTCADSDAVHCVKVRTLPEDFCAITHQTNWCSAHVGESWCICGWAYASYVGSQGAVLDIDCAGTACLDTVKAKGQCI
mmetsp:Transcript_32927/g.83419  ORF Transcript_32927/g.83419 Transcript_32927/m.83419 type:complete len:138 (+) Transcript_32927:67-480(+)